jgi:hypothetical protein
MLRTSARDLDIKAVAQQGGASGAVGLRIKSIRRYADRTFASLEQLSSRPNARHQRRLKAVGCMPKFDPHAESGPSSNADLTGRDNAERCNEFRCAIPTYLSDDLSLRRVRQPREAKQDHPRVHEALPEDQLAEVFVRSQQDSAPRVGLFQDLLIRNAGRQLGHVDDVMAVLS